MGKQLLILILLCIPITGMSASNKEGFNPDSYLSGKEVPKEDMPAKISDRKDAQIWSLLIELNLKNEEIKKLKAEIQEARSLPKQNLVGVHCSSYLIGTTQYTDCN